VANVFFLGLWLLCGLASAVFATSAVGWRRHAALAAGFIAAALIVRPDRTPDLVWAGSVVAAVAALELLRPRTGLLAAACGGAAAGISVSLFQLEGVVLPLALLLAALPMAVSAVLVDLSPRFAPPRLRDEALLIVLLLAVLVAAAPGVTGGWQSATMLNLGEKQARMAVPGWALAVGAISIVAGGLHRIWVRG
jgi:hypothetical protein